MDQPLRTFTGLVDGVAVDVEVFKDRLEWRQWGTIRRLLDPVNSGAAWLPAATAAPDDEAGNLALALVSNVVVWRAGAIFTAVSRDAAGIEVEFRIAPGQAAEIAGLFVKLLLEPTMSAPMPSPPMRAAPPPRVMGSRRPPRIASPIPPQRGREMSEEIRILRDAVGQAAATR